MSQTFNKDALTNLLGPISSRVIGVAAMPIVAVFYEPTEIGVWAAVTSVAALFLVLFTLRLDLAVVIARSDTIVSKILSLVLMVSFVWVFILSALIVLIPANYVAFFTGLSNEYVWFSVLIPIVIALRVFHMMLSSVSIRKGRFARLSLASAVQILLPLACIVTWGYFHKGSAVAYTGFMSIGILLSALLLLEPRDSSLKVGQLSKARFIAILKKYKVYPKYTVPMGFSVNIAERVLQIALVSSFSISSLGFLFFARQFTVGPAAILSNSLTQVFFRHGLQWSKDGSLALQIEKYQSAVTAIFVPMLVFGIFWCQFLSEIIFPDYWSGINYYLISFMIPAFVLILSSPTDRVSDLLGFQKLHALYFLAANFILAGVYGFCWMFVQSEEQFVLLTATGLALVQLIWIFMANAKIECQNHHSALLILRALLYAGITLAANFWIVTSFGMDWLSLGGALFVTFLTSSLGFYFVREG